MFDPAKYYRPQDPELRILGAIQTLARYRCEGIGPDFVKLNGGRILYKGEALNAWLESGTVETSTQKTAA